MSVTLSATFSRTSGDAPLVVQVSYHGTTSTQTSSPFHEVGYWTEWGDEGAGTWSDTSGKSKEWDVGPVVAHVYETPGTYTVTCAGRDSDGRATTTQEITVDDPDTTFSGTNTVCLSNDTDHTGAPAGATTVDSITTIGS